MSLTTYCIPYYLRAFVSIGRNACVLRASSPGGTCMRESKNSGTAWRSSTPKGEVQSNAIFKNPPKAGSRVPGLDDWTTVAHSSFLMGGGA